MRTFFVQLPNHHSLTIRADFLTWEHGYPSAVVFFWIKPHWYLPRRCVGVLEWDTVISIILEPTAAEFGHELGVKL